MESPESLEAFLHWLAGGNAEGARRYQEVREKLILLFRFRGCADAEDLADDTLDRAARAISRPDFASTGEPIAFIRGVARNVYLEWHRRERKYAQEPLAEELPGREPPEDFQAEREAMLSCLDSCLTKLPLGKRDLLLSYYRYDSGRKIDQRQRLAANHGIGMNALRIQVFRIRNMVQACVEQCRRREEIETPSRSFYE